MEQELFVLLGTAASLGLIHTVIGVDHYLPFVVMQKARGWSMKKTMGLTVACGMGHVLSSVVIGIVGIGLGIAVFRLELIEAWRGNVAAWLLIGFGMAYFVWGMNRADRAKTHRHSHWHSDGNKHSHEHGHLAEHGHVHGEREKSVTPWVLFIIFVLGPCEPLIPLLMYPAAKASWLGAVLVALVFGIITMVTMLVMVALLVMGVGLLPMGRVEKYIHAMSGAAVGLAGLVINMVGI